MIKYIDALIIKANLIALTACLSYLFLYSVLLILIYTYSRYIIINQKRVGIKVLIARLDSSQINNQINKTLNIKYIFYFNSTPKPTVNALQ